LITPLYLSNTKKMKALVHEIYALNEKSITVVFGNEISIDLANKVANFNRAIMDNPFSGFVTTVPAYTTVTVFYDPLIVNRSNFKWKFEFLRKWPTMLNP
jgi:allophanate hydrolase subunit 1